jgi:predicted Zn-dependent protease
MESAGCGRKSSPILEANNNQTKRDNIDFLQLLNSTRSGVLNLKSYVTQVAVFNAETLD